MSTPARLLAGLGLIVGVVALVVQFAISMQAYTAAGRDVPGALGTFFTYYTILTNIVLVLIYLAEFVGWRWLDLFRSLDVRGMMVAVMILVASFVHFFLRGLGLTGWFLACDYALHYATPLIYFLWWLVGVRHGPLLLRRIPLMLAPTVVYFLVVLARGAWVGEYPYPVLNVVSLGYPHVLLNALLLAVGLAALMMIVVAIDEVLGRLRRPGSEENMPRG
jgi:hypothetical protein